MHTEDSLKQRPSPHLFPHQRPPPWNLADVCSRPRANDLTPDLRMTTWLIHRRMFAGAANGLSLLCLHHRHENMPLASSGESHVEESLIALWPVPSAESASVSQSQSTPDTQGAKTGTESCLTEVISIRAGQPLFCQGPFGCL